MKQAESSTGETPSDAELILQVRSGDREAFGVLYERHASAARALARQYVAPADADDVVADAFSKLFEMLRRGAGPDSGFRPYLYTVVRHRAFDVSRGAARTRPTTDDEIESVLGRVASGEDPALAGFERSVVSKAYFDLPERWREVLWYVLVDDLKPAQVAPVLGLSPNGVSALLYRAKEALRAGYLQQHLTHAPSDTCRAVNPLLGGYVRENLSKRETTKVDEHLATCGTCSALVLELHDVAHGMKTVIAPLVLGAGGLALVGAGAPVGGLAIAAKAGVGASAAVGGAPAATVTVSATSAGTLSGAVSSAVSATAGAFASAAAAATGGSVAAGAIAVAAVGMVAALQVGGPSEPEPVAADTVISTTTEGHELPGAEEIGDRPVLPTDIEPDGATTSVTYLVVGYTDDSEPLAARRPQDLSLTVKNAGDVEATSTQLQITLSDGLTVAMPDGPFGTGVAGRMVPVSADPAAAQADHAEQTDHTEQADHTEQGGTPSPAATAGPEPDAASGAMPDEPTAAPSVPTTAGVPAGDGPVACTPTEQANVLLCSLGELAPGQEHEVVVPVRAGSGGDYPVSAEVWAEGMERVAIDLPGRAVAPFGAELSAATEDVSLASPGTAPLPVRMTSTGDRAVPPAGWAVDVTLPDGVGPASAQPELSCTPGELPNAWRCAPLAGTDAATTELAPGGSVDVLLNVTTAPTSSLEPVVLGAANVRPVLEGNAHPASATLVATSAWANAADGAGAAAASCHALGGADTADAVVAGTYTNTTQRAVRVTLEAAGGRASSGKDLAPGESTSLVVHDGLRVPAGQAVFVLATDVDGETYKTRVAAGEHPRESCYVPGWTADTSVATVNAGGAVGVEGTLTNRSDEAMSVVMSVPVGEGTMDSPSLPVPPGEAVTLSVNTGRAHLAAGDVVFRLSRDGVDEDGDLPAKAIVPETNPTEHFDAATIAPAAGAETVSAGTCEFDAVQDRSVRTFAVMADNTGSTLPVRFHVGDVTRVVPAGELLRIEYPVFWGTGTVDLTAAGKTLTSLDVAFDSCATLTWPTADVSVTTAPQCLEGWHAQLEAAVDNRTGHEWLGVLVRESSGDVGPERQVAAGATTTLELTRQVPFSGGGNVTVRLTRELEGRSFTVERSFWVDGTWCLGTETCEPTSDATSASTGATPAPSGQDRRWPWVDEENDACGGAGPDQA